MKKMNFSEWLHSNPPNPRAIINGENIEVLKRLHSKFDGSVSCIYIDPPYNNGEKYAFYDDDISHDEWLSQMKTILLELKAFLQNDGSIWISIDDGEMHYLKILCDSVFGRKSFIATIVWQQRNTRENRKAFSNNHEYILVYSPNPEAFKKRRNLLPMTSEVLNRYGNPDNDPRGSWQSVTANVQDGHAAPSQFYEIVAPNGKVHTPPPGRCWIYSKERMLNEIRAGNIWFGKDGNGVPRVKKFISASVKGVVPETLWLSSFAGTNKDAKTHLRKLKIYDEKLFDTPKPETLIGQIIEIATNPHELVMDVFLGSGTTVSAAHKLGRNYIGVERERTTCNYIIERMNQVILGEQGGISRRSKWHGGGDFVFIEY